METFSGGFLSSTWHRIVCVQRKLQQNQVFQHNCSLIGNPDAETSVWGCVCVCVGGAGCNFSPWSPRLWPDANCSGLVLLYQRVCSRTGGQLSVGCSHGIRTSRIYSRPKPGHQLKGCSRQAAWFKTSQADGESNLVMRFPVWLSGSQLYGCFLGLCRLFKILLHQGHGSNATVVCLIFEIRRVENLLVFYVNSVWSCGAFIFTSLGTWHELLRIQRKKDLCSEGFLPGNWHVSFTQEQYVRGMNSCGVPKWWRPPGLFSLNWTLLYGLFNDP